MEVYTAMLKRLMGYDSYERHQAVRCLVAPLKDESILDVGGGRGQLAHYVPQVKITALNVDESGDIRYEGGAFPFESGEFDIVVSLDVLEHIPAGERESFVRECARVGRRAVMIAAPWGSAGHASYEARLDRLYCETHGEHHRWLHEHVVNGLPTETDVEHYRQVLASVGFTVRVLFAGDYEWQGRTIERSLAFSRLGGWALRGLRAPFEVMLALISWREPDFSETPRPLCNRFYLIGERD
jgi:SAM-dependent methyltransferase